MADTSAGRLAFVAETTPGTTPATPVFYTLDFNSDDMEQSQNTVRSNAITPQRVVKTARSTSKQVGNGFTFELYKAAEIDALLAALTGNPWATLETKAGGSTLTSFTFERRIGSGDNYRRFTGCRINTLDLTIQPEQIVTATVGVFGHQMVTDDAIISGATYTAAGTGEKLTSLDTGTIVLGGVVGSFDFASMQLNINNNMNPSLKLGANPVRGVRAGQCQVTGTLEVYVDGTEWADAYEADETFSISVPMAYGGEGYTLTIPAFKVTSFNEGNPGNNEEFIARVGFEGVLDPVEETSFLITKTS